MGGGSSACNKCCSYAYLTGGGSQNCSWENKCTDVWGIVYDPCTGGRIDDGLFCRRPDDSIALSYVPRSYANTDMYIPTTVVKKQNIRASATPECGPCQVEYGFVLGTCYEDCNITAGIAECKNVGTVLNPKLEMVRKPEYDSRLNYTMVSTGMCGLSCPSGTTDMGTYCALPPVNRGAGTALECSGRWQQYGLQCYTPCNETAGISTWNGTAQVKRAGYEYVNYQMQSAGLCSQQCPPGTTDGGVFCSRQSYNRGVGKPKPMSNT